jgi:hypothetical protein
MKPDMHYFEMAIVGVLVMVSSLAIVIGVVVLYGIWRSL